MSAADLPIIEKLAKRPAELTLGEVWLTAGLIRQLYDALEGAIEHMEWSTPRGHDAYAKAQQALSRARGEEVGNG
jgi:hypothetical protein